MEAQSRGQHPGTEAGVIVDPVGRTAVAMQSGHMRAYPDSNICHHIEVSGKRIWLVLIDRRTPVNRDAAQNEAEKDRHIQPVTPKHQEMMPPGHEHARLFPVAYSCRSLLTWSCGTAHSPQPTARCWWTRL